MSPYLPWDDWCAACGIMRDGEVRFEKDHLIAKQLGGPDIVDNLQWLCLRCHRAKTALETVVRNKKYWCSSFGSSTGYVLPVAVVSRGSARRKPNAL